MLITDKNELKRYTKEHRIWQGIPGIEVTPKGCIFATFYSGGIKEDIGNFVMLVKSDDGEHFSEPIAVLYKENYRCFDPCLWIDPLGRMWFTWSLMPEHATYAMVCDDPDADELSWSEPRIIGYDVMMNKPTVLSTGEWLFPIAVWNDGVRVLGAEYDTKQKGKGSFVYKSVDNGETFEKLGVADVENRSYDEHMILEHEDGRLAMYVRTNYGIGVSYSFDRGKTWTKGEDSGLPGPSSRFFIRRLPSGRILLVNHDNSKERINMTAYLSEDDGATWKYSLLLDERFDVAYPDGVLAEDGYLYITYDCQRGDLLKSLDEVYSKEREILFAKITEEDIMAGKLVSPKSKLRCIISKLGPYSEEHENPFDEAKRFSNVELALFLMEKYPHKIVEKILESYSANCANLNKPQTETFDKLAEAVSEEAGGQMQKIIEMIDLVRSVSEFGVQNVPVVEKVKQVIMENIEKDLTLQEIAQEVGVSKFYMQHQFKKTTDITITEYKNVLKIAYAKKLLLETDRPVTEIAQDCGFNYLSYFDKVFKESEGITPVEYRRFHVETAK